MDNFHTYAVAVCLLAAIVSATGRGQFCAGIVAANWVLWSAFILASENYDPWAFGIALDGLSAWLLLRAPVVFRAWLALTYCMQIAAHIAFRLSTDPNPDAYYWSVSLIGWAQLVMVGGWSGGRWLLYIWDRVALLARQAGLYRLAFGRSYAA